jgi:CRP-like cAMP-binding protein
MYILAEGILDVLIAQPDKPALKVATLELGDFFGEKSLLSGEPRSATVICHIDATICEITKEAISLLIERNPKVAQLLSLAVARREAANNSARLANDEEEDSFVESETMRILNGLKNFFKLTL